VSSGPLNLDNRIVPLGKLPLEAAEFALL